MRWLLLVFTVHLVWAAQAQSFTGTWVGTYYRNTPTDKRLFFYRFYLLHRNDSLFGAFDVLNAQTDVNGTDVNEAEVIASYQVYNFSFKPVGNEFELYSGNLLHTNPATFAPAKLPPAFLKFVCKRLSRQEEEANFNPSLLYSALPAADGAVGNIGVKKINDATPLWVTWDVQGTSLSGGGRVKTVKWPAVPNLFRRKVKPEQAGPVTVVKPPAATAPQRKDVVHQTIETDSTIAFVELFDNGVVDNDTVSVLLNGKPLLTQYRLTSTGIRLEAALEQDKENKFVLLAHNEGSLPPNTALAVISVGSVRYSLTLSSSLSENAVIIFVPKALSRGAAR